MGHWQMVFSTNSVQYDWVIFEATVRHLEGPCEEEEEVSQHFLTVVVKG